MEELTKQQMVLLTLLISFVASIATSISVVSLLNENPTTITQTVNRIVEKTIEKVVPAQMLPPPTPPPPKEVPIVSESELVARAVETNLSKMVTIREGETLRGIGFAASGDALVVTDKNILGEGTEYSATFSDGKTYKALKVYTDKDSDVSILELRNEKDQVATSTPYISFSSNEPKLGSMVIALGGKEGATVSQGIVSEKTKTRITTNIPFKQIDRGGILFGVDGAVLGMTIIGGEEEKYTIPVADILSVLETYRKEAALKAPQP